MPITSDATGGGVSEGSADPQKCLEGPALSLTFRDLPAVKHWMGPARQQMRGGCFQPAFFGRMIVMEGSRSETKMLSRARFGGSFFWQGARLPSFSRGPFQEMDVEDTRKQQFCWKGQSS